MTTVEKRLVDVMGNGNGTYYTRCYWCFVTTRSFDAPDDLRLLAEAKSLGWRFDRQDDGTYRLVCCRCQYRGR